MLSNICETGTTNYDFTVKKRKFEVFRWGYFRFISPGRLNLHRPSSLPRIESPGPTSENIFLHTNKLKNNNIKLSTNDREILRGQNEERHPTVRKSHGNSRVLWGVDTDPNKTMSQKHQSQDMRYGL